MNHLEEGIGRRNLAWVSSKEGRIRRHEASSVAIAGQ